MSNKLKRRCSIVDCDNDYAGGGYCAKHYSSRVRRNGETVVMQIIRGSLANPDLDDLCREMLTLRLGMLKVGKI